MGVSIIPMESSYYNNLGMYNTNVLYGTKLFNRMMLYNYIENCPMCNLLNGRLNSLDDILNNNGYWIIQITYGWMKKEDYYQRGFIDGINLSLFHKSINWNDKVQSVAVACSKEHLSYFPLFTLYRTTDPRYVARTPLVMKDNCASICIAHISKSVIENTANKNYYGFPLPDFEKNIYTFRNMMKPELIDKFLFRISKCRDGGFVIDAYRRAPMKLDVITLQKFNYDSFDIIDFNKVNYDINGYIAHVFNILFLNNISIYHSFFYSNRPLFKIKLE